jgi:hypothetical protein
MSEMGGPCSKHGKCHPENPTGDLGFNKIILKLILWDFNHRLE